MNLLLTIYNYIKLLYKQNMEPTTFIFAGLDQKQIRYLESLKIQYNDSREWIYLEQAQYQNSREPVNLHQDQLLEIQKYLLPQSLVIAPPSEQIENLLYDKGSPFYIHWEDFFRQSHTIIQSAEALSLRKIGLAFLPPTEEKLLSSIFSLYGYSVTNIHSGDQLQDLLQNGLNYLILNLDFPESIARHRNKLLNLVKYAVFHEQRLTVNVVKDFNRGSLFEDLASPVREFCNLILSPQEYILFIKQYLYERAIDRVKFLHKGLWTYEATSYIKPGSKIEQSLPLNNIFSPLKNYRKSFEQLQQNEDQDKRKQFILDIETVEMRNSLLKWLDPYLMKICDQQSTGHFAFVSNPNQVQDQPYLQPIPREMHKPVGNALH